MNKRIICAILILIAVTLVHGAAESERRAIFENLGKAFGSAQQKATQRPHEISKDHLRILRQRVALGGFEEPRVQVIVNRILLGAMRNPSGSTGLLSTEARFYVEAARHRHETPDYACWTYMEAAARLAVGIPDSELPLEVYENTPMGCRCRVDLVPLLEVQLYADRRYEVLSNSSFAEERLKRWGDASSTLVAHGRSDTGFAERQRPKVAQTAARKVNALLKLGRTSEAKKLSELAEGALGAEAFTKAMRDIEGRRPTGVPVDDS